MGRKECSWAYRQGGVNFVVNREPDSFAQSFARVHGPSACSFAIRVKDAAKARQRALELGAKPHHGPVGPMELNIPAIQGIGGSLIYLVDRYPGNGSGLSIYDVDFVPVEGVEQQPAGAGLLEVDHLTHNVYAGRMDVWAQFYEKLFDFREIRYFDIKGRRTGLTSRAFTSPCGKIRIPINEPSDRKSQIQEYLDAYHGEGIQHIALSSADIFETVEALRRREVRFLDTPDTYYWPDEGCGGGSWPPWRNSPLWRRCRRTWRCRVWTGLGPRRCRRPCGCPPAGAG